MTNTLSKKSLKFGAIGCSRVAKKYFFPAIKNSEFTELGFVGSRSLEKAKTWANENNSNFFGHYDEVLESDVDAVYISLPISMHEEWVTKAAKLGKHILCEKSSTTSYSSEKIWSKFVMIMMSLFLNVLLFDSTHSIILLKNTLTIKN